MADVLNPPADVGTSPPVPLKPLGKVVAVTSGKGGVGKTFVSANLAAALARRGLRVLVLDADLGLANLDVVLNLYPKVTLHDVFTGKAKLEDAIIRAPGGFSVLLAGSGMVEYSRLTPEVRDAVQKCLATQTEVGGAGAARRRHAARAGGTRCRGAGGVRRVPDRRAQLPGRRG